MNRSDYWKNTHALHQLGTPFVVVTVISTRGHTPQDPGAKAIVTVAGLHWGTVGGGKIEAHSIRFAQAMLQSSPATSQGPLDAPELVTWNLQRDIGMSCGGEVTYLFEIDRSAAWKIVIFGAGHVAQAVVRALEPLECQITCIDPRPEWLERLPISPKVKAVETADSATFLKSLDGDSYFVTMTQGHALDLPILEALMRTHPSAPYIGGIGSNVKALKLRKELKELGVPPEALARFHCPIGLPFGTNHPAEIAISLVAQLLQVRDAV